MSMGQQLGSMPNMRIPSAPSSPMTRSGTYTANYAVQPMPQNIAQDLSQGWNYQTGRAIAPMSPQMQSGAYTPPIGNLGIKIPTQSVYPLVPGARPGAPTGLTNTTATSKTQANYNMGRR
jgi:hypothetical protein